MLQLRLRVDASIPLQSHTRFERDPTEIIEDALSRPIGVGEPTPDYHLGGVCSQEGEQKGGLWPLAGFNDKSCWWSHKFFDTIPFAALSTDSKQYG